MFKAYSVFVCFLICLSSPLLGNSVTLKSVDGNEAKFKIESIELEGVSAMPEKGYKPFFIKWEQLDLEFVEQNLPAIWKKKRELERLSKLAYEEFYFGQSSEDVLQIARARNGKAVSGEFFEDTNANALWVCWDTETFRYFTRFLFTADKRLKEIEVRKNFDPGKSMDTEFKPEWERLIDMVDGFQSELEVRNRFPRADEWREWERAAEKGGPSAMLTHQWNDSRRAFELSLQSKQFNWSVKPEQSSGITFFGASADSSIILPSRQNTSWVILRAKAVRE